MQKPNKDAAWLTENTAWWENKNTTEKLFGGRNELWPTEFWSGL